MKNLVFVKKENNKTDLVDKLQAKSVFFSLSKSRGITLIALVISIIVILILAGISLNVTIGNGGIISKAQNSKLKSEESNAESEVLSALATLDTEYYQKATADSGVSVDTIYNINGLQKYVNGKVNGFNYNKDGETVVYYTNESGSYTVKIKDGNTTMYSGIYVTKDENPYIYMSSASGNNTVSLSTDLKDVVWASLDENIATVDPKTGLVTKKGKGTVVIEGKTEAGELVYVTIWDDDEIQDGGGNGSQFAKEVNVVERKKAVNIGATASDNVEASIVINDKGETVLQISGTGNMFDSEITFDEYSEENYNAVTSIVIEEGIKNITENAFVNFTKTKSITIASTVENIESYYLIKLKEIETINMNAKQPTIKGRVVDGTDCYCSPSSTLTSIIIGEDVEKITDFEFAYYNGVKSVRIPNNVKEIGIASFESCESLENIILSNNLTTIGDYAFWNCLLLKSINIPSSVTSIGKQSFQKCNSLTSITIPENVTSIGRYAFSYCNNINSVYYNAINCDYLDYTDESESEIYPLFERKDDTFNVNIKNIIIGNKVKKIPSGIFSFTTSVTEINIPDSVETIGDYAFYDCLSVTSLKIGKGVTSIGYESFGYLSTLTEVTIPENVKSIELYAFSYCTSLKTVYYNAIEADYYGVTYNYNTKQFIGYPMFYKCQKITSIIIGDKVKKIGDYIFSNLPSITEITLPESLEIIGMWAVAYDTSLQTIYYNSINCSTDGIFWSIDGMNGTGVPFQGTISKNIIIGDKVEKLNEYLFGYCNMETITIPSNVNYISVDDDYYYGTFDDCANLKEILIKKPEGSISGAPWSNVSGITVKWNQ
jgi:hypothetical protein